jgi:hypothetical protein
MRIKQMIFNSATFYIIIIAILAGLLYLSEIPGKSRMVFSQNDKPTMDRLFVPVKVDVAVKLFRNPVVLDDVHLKTKKEKTAFVISGKQLEDVLDFISMRSPSMWKELEEYDPKLKLSADNQTLVLGIYHDKGTDMDYVNVPAGLLRAYIK